MRIINREDVEDVQILINEFLVTNKVESKESIPIEFLKYLREVNLKIEDGTLLNELCDLFEQKFGFKQLH